MPEAGAAELGGDGAVGGDGLRREIAAIELEIIAQVLAERPGADRDIIFAIQLHLDFGAPAVGVALALEASLFLLHLFAAIVDAVAHPPAGRTIGDIVFFNACHSLSPASNFF